MKKWVFLGMAIVLLLAVSLLLFRGGGGGYREVITIEDTGVKVKILSKDGTIKAGNNRIRIEVSPPKNLRELYFYMPPCPAWMR
ncbi:MAG: hypothetical protein Q9N34_02445 [Aquificota bacterium]|nr:hypothetical protein [Aquificota bacterium]